MSCPRCRESAKFVGYRETSAMTLAGGVEYARAYYHCPHCHHGWSPTDEEMGIEQQKTSGCCEVVSLTGTVEPCAEVAELFDLGHGGHPFVVERRAGNRQPFQFGQSFQCREARTIKTLHPERRMKERERPQVGQRGEHGQARIADLNAIGSQLFQFGQPRQMRQRSVGQTLALPVKRQALHLRELADRLELGVPQLRAILEEDLRDNAVCLRDLRAEVR